uniref:O-methyltransferase n=1 Tax=Candidatus Kentrum sp. LPFa TaxID=2126335 RepID=A0A450X9K7_9GAMM|nr:MAG: O-methyltransferase [Candidatus Kentron sp. LPFa]VFK25965.1 MAG: O-methyltransferase [Candidatus Kentron sp. LPFa]
MRGILFDLEYALAEVPKVLQASGVAERCQCVSGSFFESVPIGAQLYLIARVLFNWDDDRALRILKQARAAMKPNATLLMVEMALPDAGPAAAAESATSLNLLALLGVTLRTVSEYHALLAQAGFTVRRSDKMAQTEFMLFETGPLNPS